MRDNPDLVQRKINQRLRLPCWFCKIVCAPIVRYRNAAKTAHGRSQWMAVLREDFYAER